MQNRMRLTLYCTLPETLPLMQSVYLQSEYKWAYTYVMLAIDYIRSTIHIQNRKPYVKCIVSRTI